MVAIPLCKLYDFIKGEESNLEAQCTFLYEKKNKNYQEGTKCKAMRCDM